MIEQGLDTDIVRRSFFNTSIADIYRAIDGGSFIGAYTLLFCSIDALANVSATEAEADGGNYCNDCGQQKESLIQTCETCGKHRQASDAEKIFRRWCERWIKKGVGQKNCQAQFLYELRCGLVHAHGMGKSMKGVGGYQLQHDLPTNHWQHMPVTSRMAEAGIRPGYILNLESLLAEYALAAWKFFDWLEVSWADQQATVMKRLTNLVGLFGTDPANRIVLLEAPPTSFAQMHYGLAVFDNSTDLTADDVRYGIHQIYERRPGTCKCNTVFKEIVEERDRLKRLKRFDFERLAAFGKALWDLSEHFADEKLSEEGFRKQLRTIGNSADSVLVGFPDTEFQLSFIPDFRKSLKALAFESKKQGIDDLFDDVHNYLDDFSKAYSDMLHEAVSFNLIADGKQRELLRGMGIHTSGGLF